MRTLIQDLRYAFRTLWKSPGFTAVAVITLALGIGAGTSIVSVVDTLMLRDLPYPDAERLVTVWQHDRREENNRADVSPGNFIDWRERASVFEGLAAAEPYSMALTGDGRPVELVTNLVTEGFFDILGVRPILGRTFRPEEFLEGQGRVVMLSHELWQGRFGGDPEIVAQTFTLDGAPYEVVGVLPPTLELGLPQVESGLWTPQPRLAEYRTVRGGGWWNVVGRLATGVTLTQARAEMDKIATNLAREYPSENTGIGATVVGLRENLVGGARPALLALLAAVGLVLLVACANVANLLLARGSERERELAIRRAVGAGRGRLLAQLFTESLLLALAGGAAGVLLAVWGVNAIQALSPGDIPRLDAVSVDLRVLGIALGITVLTALAFGVAPALELTRSERNPGLRGGSASPGTRHRRFHGALVVVQMGLALVLLVGAGLLLRSFATLLRTDPGFAAENVLALQVFAWDGNPTAAERVLFFSRSLEEIRALPGVVAAGAVSAAPFLKADIASRTNLRILGRPAAPEGQEPLTYVATATPGFFRAASIPVLAGRVFSEADRAETVPVALINQTLRQQEWPGADPIGDRIRLGDEEGNVEAKIVGVVGAVRHTGLDAEPRPEVFLPQPQTGFASMTYLVRTRGDPAAAMEAVQNAIWRVDPNLTFYQAAPLEALVSDSVAGRRFSLVLLAAFAAIALLVAAIGLYGVVRFAVSRRTRELGVRLALGADRRTLLRLVVGQAMRPAVLGAVLGIGAALAGARAMRSLLYGIAPWDGVTLAGAAALLLGAALAAAYLPARRATRVDPVTALRAE